MGSSECIWWGGMKIVSSFLKFFSGFGARKKFKKGDSFAFNFQTVYNVLDMNIHLCIIRFKSMSRAKIPAQGV